MHPVQVVFARPQTYVAAESIDHALRLLNDPALQPARLVAGATDLLLEIERGARRGIATLIDLSRIEDLAQISYEHGPDGQTIAVLGPGVTHNMVISEPALIAGALPLAQACLEVGSAQLRNRATVVGNIVTASPANDTLSALMALRAEVELRSLTASRTVAVEDFITGFRTTVLGPEELVCAVRIPLVKESQRAMFVKVGNRTAQAISVVHLAIAVQFDGSHTVIDSRLAIGSVAARVVVLDEVAEALRGRRLDETTIAQVASLAGSLVAPIDDVRASAEYRRAIVPVIVGRALSALAADQQASQWPNDPPLLAVAVPARSGPVPLAVEGVTTAIVNGESRSAAHTAGMTALQWIREGLGLCGTKEGCAEGECGACTIQLDGKAVMACLVPAQRLAGSHVVTVEGLATDAGPHPLQRAFIDNAAAQCGFCTPGFIVAGASLLAECPQPSDEQICHGLAGNLCRCTGYTAIIAAVKDASS